ncbi:MAG: flavodoxin domain-containing protein [Anaerolineae bacterium]
MRNKILVAYATRTGSTREVAEFVAQILRKAGAEVDVRLAREIFDLSWYDGVVLGTAIRDKHALPEAITFAQRHQRQMRDMPVAYFTLGITMIENTPQNRQLATGYIEPLLQAKQPVSLGLFAGRIDQSLLSWPRRLLLSLFKSGPMAEADHRDWDKIRDWAEGLIPVLLHAHPVYDNIFVAEPA